MTTLKEITQEQLQMFYREYCWAFDSIHDAPELWEFEAEYVLDHPEFATIMSASTADERRRASTTVGIEICCAAEQLGRFADLIKFFGVTCMGDLEGIDILGHLKEIATDQQLPDEMQRQAIRLWSRAQPVNRQRDAQRLFASLIADDGIRPSQ